MLPNNLQAPRHHRRVAGWAAVVVGLTAVVALAACSGDRSSTSTASTAGPSESTVAGSTAKPSGGGDFCVRFKELNSATQRLPEPGSPDEAGSLRAFGTLLEESAAKLQASAPAELRAPMELFVRNSNQAATSFKAGTRPPARTQSPEETAAGDKITKYVADSCGG